MGRQRWKNKDLPPRMVRRQLVRGVRFYYDHPSGRREPLGGEYLTALAKYAEIEQEHIAPRATIRSELETFRREYLPTLKEGTRYMYERAIARLTAVFGDCAYEDIQKVHLTEYVRRSQAKTLARRDVACLSSAWSWALDEGRTSVPNPREGMRFRKEKKDAPRPCTDVEFQAVYAQADWLLQDVLDILYYSGQDVRVVLNWRREHARWDEGVLDTTRSKTERQLRIELTGEFARVIKRAIERPRKAQGLHIVSDERGQRVTYMRIWSRFRKARKAAGVDFELRAIRRKAGSDADSLGHAQELLGHSDTATTRRHYRVGERVKPVQKSRDGQ